MEEAEQDSTDGSSIVRHIAQPLVVPLLMKVVHTEACVISAITFREYGQSQAIIEQGFFTTELAKLPSAARYV